MTEPEPADETEREWTPPPTTNETIYAVPERKPNRHYRRHPPR